MTNQSLSTLLDSLADILELKNDNPFRIRAFRRAARTIDSFPKEIDSLNRKDLLAIPGIGKGIADIVEEFSSKGKVREFESLKKEFPDGVLQIMNLPGLGPKRAAQLFNNLKIDSLPKLTQAAKTGRLLTLPGFGQKMQEEVLKNVAFSQEASKRLLLTEAQTLAKKIQSYLQTSPVIQNLTLAGSLRRWKETVGDLDFLCTSPNPEKAMDQFIKGPHVKRVLVSGQTKASLILENGFQCDFRVVDPKSYGAATLYFTGSKEHNIRLRELCLKKGFSLNEYGLYRVGDKLKKKPVAGRTEEEIYQRLGLPWIPPELREDRGEIEAGLKKTLPHLLTEKDVQGDFHNHTNLSDGAHTIEEMAQAACESGWAWYFCGDHSPSLTIASGLSHSQLSTKMKKIKNYQSKNNKFQLFCGSEVDILKEGQMDYPNSILEKIDCVVASVHSRFKMSKDEMTTRICRALENPHVDILGHLSGRLLNRREGYIIDREALLQKAKQTQTAIEINGQPERQELSDIYVKRAIELGVPLALTTDAHSKDQLKNMTTAVHIARRGWAEAKNILNSYSTPALLKWLER